ncbi:MAG: ABC transporter substrate-binding protein [Eubacteriales bacterium]|nr:ABC transporter substrate-binding protein [Eubacteriales bacterium]
MKKILALALALVMTALCATCGCAENAAEYYGNDVSAHESLVMYVIGDEPTDSVQVSEKINQLMEEKLNTSLSIYYIPLSDYEQKYSLLLASGTDIDIMYTSTWAFYNQEATKGAFTEITAENLEKYMPQTHANESQMAFEQARINGVCYMVARNNAYINNAVPVLIRGDLREKYGMEPIDSVEKLEAYFKAIAENEEGIYPYAAAGAGVDLSINLFQSRSNLLPLAGLDKYFGYFYQEGQTPTADDIVWQLGTDAYLAYATQMKSWADMGFWSKNAVSNSISPRDAFENGTSASVFWNIDTCESIKNVVDISHPEWKAELINITPGVVHAEGMYTGDGFAFPATSKKLERAMMALDLLKNDKQLYDLARYGIEGVHYVATSDTTYVLGEGSDGYTVANAPISWGLKNDNLERIMGEAGASISDIRVSLFSDAISEISSGFIFDETPVKPELAAISDLCSQYVPMLELGLVDDVQASLDEFNSQCERAGLNTVLEEVKAQFNTYLAGLK